jgi:glutamine synthetase
VLLAAGAAGVAEHLPLPPPVQADPGSWSASEREEQGVAPLPATQAEQEAALTGNPRIPGVLGDELLGAFVAVRRSDAAAAEGRPMDEVLAALRWRY